MGSGSARHPDALLGELIAEEREDGRRGAVGADAAARLQDDHPVDQGERLGDPVLDQDQRGVRVVRAGDRRADQRAAGRVEVGGRLVEQQQARPWRQDPGEGQALLLAAGQS
nr:hypothetical protein GCM10020092_091040 [Actinoplanes digitatis]